MNQTPFQAFKLETFFLFFINRDLKLNGIKKGVKLETFLKKVQKKLALKNSIDILDQIEGRRLYRLFRSEFIFLLKNLLKTMNSDLVKHQNYSLNGFCSKRAKPLLDD